MSTDIKDEVIQVEGKEYRFGDLTIDDLGYFVIDFNELHAIKCRLEREV